MKNVLDLDHLQAKQYFLNAESYCNFDLPQYFVFQELLDNVSQQLNGKKLTDFYNNSLKPSELDDVNYIFLNNKDGKFSWRPSELIHPALYVSLINCITEHNNWQMIQTRFQTFASNSNITCYSIPLVDDENKPNKENTIQQWWKCIEQQSLELSLHYEYVLHTDISDCYGSIYTHSIPWAIHTKQTAKSPANKNNNSLIGNNIDKHLRDMSYGQTNGIPQGSVLMDFIAEIVLGYADSELSHRVKEENLEDYKIIRYRDDYRIFSNNPQNSELIAKLLTEILIELSLRLNAQKTLLSNNIIRASLKTDKLYWIKQKHGSNSIQEHLLLIHDLSEAYPNSGSLSKALNKFHNRINNLEELKDTKVLISIVVDIMYKNPNTYPITTAILSKLLSLLSEKNEIELILESITHKLSKIPNTGHIQIWLQRLTIKIDRQKFYDEKLSRKINDANIILWNSTWLSTSLKNIIDQTAIIDEDTISQMEVVIEASEVQLFNTMYDNGETD